MQLSCLALVLALAVSGEAAVLRGRAESLSLQLEELESGDWAALSEAESEDRSFLLAQLDETESELVRIQRSLEAAEKPHVLAGLQISATPVVKKANVPAPAAKAAVKAPEAKTAAKAPEAKTAAKAPEAKAAAKDLDPAKMAASLGIPSMPSLGAIKGLKNQAALAPMLAMLKGLYEDSKDRISQQNVREEKSKKWFTAKEAEHKTKMANIDGKFANHTLSEEFHTNETRDEMRYFNYWQRCRERQHRQFHTNLKIQHAMMTKVKKMVTMYEAALSPKASDQTQAKKQLSQMTGMPEIVFMQTAVRAFLQESLVEVRKEREQLETDSEAAKAGMTY